MPLLVIIERSSYMSKFQEFIRIMPKKRDQSLFRYLLEKKYSKLVRPQIRLPLKNYI